MTTDTTAAPVKLSAGELAARAFECFEQRYSLAEVVIALRVEPKVVRELFHEWQVGLVQGELRRRDVALPPEQAVRHVDHDELDALLASLPACEPTRISVARYVDNYEVASGASYHEVHELGGFLSFGGASLSELLRRYGQITMRVTATDPVAGCLRWECLLSEAPRVPGTRHGEISPANESLADPNTMDRVTNRGGAG